MLLRWPISAPATVTLAGLRIDCAQRTPAALHNQLIPWHRIASLRDTVVLPLDPRGRLLRHEGSVLRLKLPNSRAGRLAKRALRRAVARAFDDGSISIRGDWSCERCDARASAVILTICIAGLIVFFIAGAVAVAQDLLGAPLPMLALGAVAGLIVSMGIVALALSLAPVWRQASVLRLRADSHDLRLILTGARRRRIAWTELRDVSPVTILLRLDTGQRIWLPNRQRALTELLSIVRRQRTLGPNLVAAGALWTVLLLILPVLSALTIWWNASLGLLLPPTPPQTILFIALAPAIIGLLPTALALIITRRRSRPSVSAP